MSKPNSLTAFDDGIENQTLTASMLENLPSHLSPTRSGKYIRAGCPFHGSTHQRSLSINTETQSFKCFSCGAWGYTEEGRANYKNNIKDATRHQPRATIQRRKISTTQPEPLDSDISQYQSNLNQASQYLDRRKIPFAVAEKLGAGVGTIGGAARLILPHTNPAGEVVSLYGRRLDGATDFKHYHLPRPKGIFNAKVMECEDIWITEGAFDCLALIASGIPNAIAVFGLNGIRWDWLKNTKRIILCFDIDDSGIKAIKEQAEQAHLRGIDVLAITRDELGGANDIAEAWEKGTLNIGSLPGGNKASKLQPATDADIAKVIDANKEENKPVDTRDWRFYEIMRKIPSDPPAGWRGGRPAWVNYLNAAWEIAYWYADDFRKAGWTELQLFGIPRYSSSGGLACHLGPNVDQILTIDDEKVSLVMDSGSHLAIYKLANTDKMDKGLKMPF